MSLVEKNISQLIDLMKLNEVSSEEIIKECIANIENETVDSSIYQLILKDEAISKAREIDRKRKNKEPLGPLAGIPFLVTDDISIKEILTTAGSKLLENYIPPFNGTVVEKILAADAIIIGKLQVSEFGLTPIKTVSKALKDRGAVFA